MKMVVDMKMVVRGWFGWLQKIAPAVFVKSTILRFICFQEIRAHPDLLEDEIPVHPLAPPTDPNPRAPPAYKRAPLTD